MTIGIGWKTNLMFVNEFDIPSNWVEEVDRAIGISEKHNFIYSEGLLYLMKFYLLVRCGQMAAAQQYFQKVLGLAKELQNPRINANLRQIQARMATAQGNMDAGEALFLQAIEEFLTINDLRNVLHCRSDLAHLYRRTGKKEEALPLYRETIQKWLEEGSRPAVAHQLECFAFMANERGKYNQAALLLGRAWQTREELNAHSKHPEEIAELQQAIGQLAEVMGEEERDRVMAEGAKMSLDEAVAIALREIA